MHSPDPELLRNLTVERERARREQAAAERLAHQIRMATRADRTSRRLPGRSMVDRLTIRLRWVTSLW